MSTTTERPRDMATERDLARANSIATNMALEAQYLTDEVLGELLDRVVASRLRAEAAAA